MLNSVVALSILISFQGSAFAQSYDGAYGTRITTRNLFEGGTWESCSVWHEIVLKRNHTLRRGRFNNTGEEFLQLFVRGKRLFQVNEREKISRLRDLLDSAAALNKPLRLKYTKCGDFRGEIVDENFVGVEQTSEQININNSSRNRYEINHNQGYSYQDIEEETTSR